MATLTRRSGITVTFGVSELNTILAALRLNGQARAFSNDVAFANTEIGLLIIDVSWNVGLRLAEVYEVRPDDTMPFGLGFFIDEARQTVHQALASSGYIGPLPLTNLADASMVFWGSEGRVYVTSAGAGASLVSSEGLFGGVAGRIRSLQAGAGISVTMQNDVVVLATTAEAPDLTGYVPFSAYTPFKDDVLANAVFRRVLGDMHATLLSPSVQLVDTTTTDLRVSNSFEIVQGAVLTGTIPEVGVTMLTVDPNETRAKSFVASAGSQQTRLTSTGLSGGTHLRFLVGTDESMILSQGSLTLSLIHI